jgi:membrane protein
MARTAEWLDRLYLNVDRRVGGRLTLLVRTALAFDQDDGAVMSRSIAYYALFSLFPLLLVLMSIASFVLASGEAQQLVVDLVEQYMPAVADLVEVNIEQILQAQSTVGILALVGLLWSASGVFTAIYRAVNRAWGNPKSELFWAEKLYGLAVVLAFGLLLVGTTFYSTIVSVVQSWQLPLLGWEPLADPGVDRLKDWLSALLPILVSVVTFTVLYRTVPRNRVTWRDVWLGGLMAGLVWEAARRLFTWYLANLASYSLIYGSVEAIIAFLLWAYLSAMIVLLGAEFTAQYSQWRQAGRPVETRPPQQWIQEWSK